MRDYLLKKLIKYKKIMALLVILLSLFFIGIYLYNNVYKPFNEIINIYVLRGDTNFTAIQTGSLDNVYNTIKDKVSGDKEVVVIIVSPF